MTETNVNDPSHAIAWIRLSVAAAVATIVLKFLAWWRSPACQPVIGRDGVLRQSGRSGIRLVMLKVAAEPPDAEHPWGHNKAEYFSSGFEGSLIFIAAAAILWAAIPRLLHPQPLEELASACGSRPCVPPSTFSLHWPCVSAGKRLHSVVLEADAAHLMTDVWTSVGVVGGLIGYLLTGWLWLDAVIAILVALHILSEGWKSCTSAGWMDGAMSEDEIQQIAIPAQPCRSERALPAPAHAAGPAPGALHMSISSYPATGRSNAPTNCLMKSAPGLQRKFTARKPQPIWSRYIAVKTASPASAAEQPQE